MSNLTKRNEMGNMSFPSLFKNSLLSDFFDSEMPAVNIKETKKDFKVEVSTPGYDKGDINLKIDKNILIISAKKQDNKEEKGEDEKILRQEFSSSSFYQSFTIPENVDTEKIAATQKNGVLKIVLPKMEHAPEDKKRIIEIK